MNPILHRSLENVCLKAIAKDPAERYPTAKALADDLTRWLQGEDVVADLPLQRRRRRQKTQVLLGAAALVLLTGLGFFAFSPSFLDRELMRAADLARRGDDPAARAAYDAILAQWPGEKTATAAREELRRRLITRGLEMAEGLLAQGRSSEALDAFTRVLMENPREQRALQGWEEAKRRLISSGAESKADPK